MEEIKNKWVKLNEEYDNLILSILNEKVILSDSEMVNIKKMQNELYDLESLIFNQIQNS
jgi:hypothetical protein